MERNSTNKRLFETAHKMEWKWRNSKLRRNHSFDLAYSHNSTSWKLWRFSFCEISSFPWFFLFFSLLFLGFHECFLFHGWREERRIYWPTNNVSGIALFIHNPLILHICKLFNLHLFEVYFANFLFWIIKGLLLLQIRPYHIYIFK